MLRFLVFLTVMSVNTPLFADINGIARVIDGDTLAISGARIRLHGIDAPESRQLCQKDGQSYRCGQQATVALKLVGVRYGPTLQPGIARPCSQASSICKLGRPDAARLFLGDWRTGWRSEPSRCQWF